MLLAGRAAILSEILSMIFVLLIVLFEGTVEKDEGRDYHVFDTKKEIRFVVVDRKVLLSKHVVIGIKSTKAERTSGESSRLSRAESHPTIKLNAVSRSTDMRLQRNIVQRDEQQARPPHSLRRPRPLRKVHTMRKTRQ